MFAATFLVACGDSKGESEDEQGEGGTESASSSEESGSSSGETASSEETASGTGDTGTGESWPFVEAELDVSTVETFGDALAAQVAAGDGAGVDTIFRNSGVVIDEAAGTYFAVNGVHPVTMGDYSSYYPKSIVEASLATDTIVEAYAFSELNGHEVDMEALTWAEAPDTLYVGDEYNYIYELSLADGAVTREWDLADVGVSTSVDQGIEAMTYAASSGLFYVGIQGDQQILALDLGLDGGESVEQVSAWDMPDGWAPSGLFAHADGTIYVVSIQGGGMSTSQMIFRYQADGELLCELTIPEALGMTRPDGIYIDASDEQLYLVDSQGPLYEGHSLYRIGWTDPCNPG